MEEQKIIENPKIYAAIAGVIGDCSPVMKDKTNKQQGFKYRSVDDVFNAVNPALAKNKVIIVPNVLSRTCEVIGKTKNGADMVRVVCDVEYTLFAEDGSFVKSIIPGEGLDTGDKATNKAMAVAYKYLCFQVFCIPTDELVDPDAECPEEKDPVEQKPSSQKTARKSRQQTEKASESNNAAHTSKEPEPKGTTLESQKITQDMIDTIHSEMKRKNVDEGQVLGLAGIKKMEDMTIKGYEMVMEAFRVTPDYTGGK